MPKKYRTTKAHLEIYIGESLKWLNTLGIKEWGVEFKHDLLEDAYACCYFWPEAMACELVLSTEWTEKPTDEEVRLCAKHEVLHVLLRPIIGKATSMYAYRGHIEPIEHALINKLIWLLK